MSAENNKKLVIQWYEMTNTRDLSVLDRFVEETFSPDFVLHDPGFPDFGRGPEAMKQTMHQIMKDFPDVHVSLEDVFAEGDRVANRCVITGTHATTGELLNLQTIGIDRFSEGKFVESWGLEAPAPVTEKA